MSNELTDNTGLGCLCNSCFWKVYNQSNDPEVPEDLSLLALIEFDQRQSREQICVFYPSKFETLDVAGLELYAKNLENKFDKASQVAAVDELLKRNRDMEKALEPIIPDETWD